MKKQKIAGIAIIIIILAAAVLYFASQKNQEFHEHANFAVYLDGVMHNFSQPKYMPTEDEEVGLHALVHMHDMNGGVIHLHEPGIKLGMFFDSIGIKLNSTCFVLDDGTSYCNSPGKILKVYVNGVESHEYGTLKFHDLDKILVTFGDGSQLEQQLASVPADACIYSNKCEAPAGFVNNESLSCKTGQKENSC